MPKSYRKNSEILNWKIDNKATALHYAIQCTAQTEDCELESDADIVGVCKLLMCPENDSTILKKTF